jgi:PleD family two-component response regulator
MENKMKTVLVAVSDVFFYTKIRDALRSNEYVLERVRTQEEVPEKAVAHRPVAFILNMNDEKLDAFKALGQIKGDTSLQQIPVLAFANHEEIETWRRAKELGVDKIVSRNEFSSRTKNLIDEMIAIGHPLSASATHRPVQSETDH